MRKPAFKSVLFMALALIVITGASSKVLAQRDGQLDPGSQNESPGLVLTSLPVTYSLTSALLKDTGIQVQNLPERGRRLSGLPNYFNSRADRLADTFAAATAVVTIGKLWPGDPLYMAARQSNIRIVEIDATKPWSNTLEGVTVAMEPHSTAAWSEQNATAQTPSVWYWLSLTNAVRSADIVAGDLVRLFPGVEQQIIANQLELRGSLLDMQRRYELALASVPDITVYSLAPELVYFTSELGLFVDGTFFKQDIDWTDEDLEAFESYLRDNRIPVVLHKWEPEQPILQAINGAGAELVVLETLDAGVVEGGNMVADSYQRLMEENLENLLSALNGR